MAACQIAQSGQKYMIILGTGHFGLSKTSWLSDLAVWKNEKHCCHYLALNSLNLPYLEMDASHFPMSKHLLFPCFCKKIYQTIGKLQGGVASGSSLTSEWGLGAAEGWGLEVRRGSAAKWPGTEGSRSTLMPGLHMPKVAGSSVLTRRVPQPEIVGLSQGSMKPQPVSVLKPPICFRPC